MKIKYILSLLALVTIFNFNCSNSNNKSTEITAAEILGNPQYLAMSYGGFRHYTRDTVPSIEELKEDLKLLAALNIKLIRTYNTQQFGLTANLLKAIRELKTEDSDFEMYVMLGTWIECEGAWTTSPSHDVGGIKNNTAEIETAISMINTYPDIIKIIAVGNEAMVNWAASYYVKPKVVLKWVNHLQELKQTEKIPADTWITSSDNYESWGGGNKTYQTKDLAALIKAVDFVSLHTYPFHDSHYNPAFWGVPAEEGNLSDVEKIDAAMLRAKNYAITQYQGAADYIKSLGIEKPIHIGETGWASISDDAYGATGSKAADEFKQKLYYDLMRAWTAENGMSCFFFEAFDEKWKDKNSPSGSENHFGLINLEGEAKYVLWDKVDSGVFDGLTRGGKTIVKTYKGDKSALMTDVITPLLTSEMGIVEISTINEKRKVGEVVTEEKYIIATETMESTGTNKATYPSAKLKLNVWESTCNIEMSNDKIIKVETGTGEWWGAGLEIQADGKGENLSGFADGYLNVEIKGNTTSTFEVGFQTGRYADGTQVNNAVTFAPKQAYSITENWKTFSIKILELNKGANLKDVTGLLYFRGVDNFDGKPFYVKNVYYSK